MTPDTTPATQPSPETPAARRLPARRLVALPGGDAVELVPRPEAGGPSSDPTDPSA